MTRRAGREGKPSPGHGAGRTLAALVGTAPVALAAGVTLTLALPLPLAWRLLVGPHAVMPLWVALMCAAFLARDGRRAWGRLGVAFAAAALVSAVALALGRGVLPPAGAGP